MLNVDEIKLLSQRLYTKKQIQSIIPCINDISLCDMKWSCGSWNILPCGKMWNKIRSSYSAGIFHICEANLTRLKAARSPLHYSLLLLTSKKSSLKGNGKWKVKSEEVISKKSSFLRMRIFWRREWDSNPRDVAVKRFSRKLGFVSPRRSYFISDSMAVHSKSFSAPFLSSLSISCSLYCKKLILQ